VRRRFGGSTPSTSVDADVGVGGVVSSVGGVSFGIRRKRVSATLAADGSSSGSRISRLTICQICLARCQMFFIKILPFLLNTAAIFEVEIKYMRAKTIKK
jgi:hypothetical protein